MWHEPSPSIEVLTPDRREAARHTVTSHATKGHPRRVRNRCGARGHGGTGRAFAQLFGAARATRGRWEPGSVMGWTMQHARHAAAMVKQDGNPAARVYESIGSDCFLALAPGWLNLGLWEGPGSGSEDEAACRRMVRPLALALTPGGTILDVGNGLATQDPLIAEAIRPRRLVAVNITEWQLAAGRGPLRGAAARPRGGRRGRPPARGRA